MAPRRRAGLNAGCRCEADRQPRSPAGRTTGGTGKRPLLRAPDSGHYEVASDAGGHRAAAIYSLIETAKLNRRNPQHYLADMLARIADHPARQIADLLPWNWTPADLQRAAARPGALTERLRRAFHGAARAWVLDAIDKGALTAGDIKNGLNATRALLPEAEGTLPRVRHRPMILRLEILPNAVDDLCRLGWLDGAGHRVDAAIAGAVVGLVERAIALRLGPY